MINFKRKLKNEVVNELYEIIVRLKKRHHGFNKGELQGTT
jgi:hypothetical protein